MYWGSSDVPGFVGLNFDREPLHFRVGDKSMLFLTQIYKGSAFAAPNQLQI